MSGEVEQNCRLAPFLTRGGPFQGRVGLRRLLEHRLVDCSRADLVVRRRIEVGAPVTPYLDRFRLNLVLRARRVVDLEAKAILEKRAREDVPIDSDFLLERFWIEADLDL